MTSSGSLKERVRAAARAEGFARTGVADATRLETEAEHLDAWLREGRHGEMRWMAETAEVRKDPRDPKMLPRARSVVVMAAPYAAAAPPAEGANSCIAKYALGRDYHNVLTKKARRVARLLETAGAATRVAVDSKPVFERAWAERAGVGFVGKNCCLIVPGLGSHVLLACLVTDAFLEPDTPIARRCGSCSLCLDACPTRAFVEPRSLDARRCISYLTIEHRGPIPQEHRASIGAWLFGCDACQDVCPYNRGASACADTMDALQPVARWAEVDPSKLLRMNEEQFQAWSRGSPLKRPRREGLARNAAIVLGNRGRAVHLRVLDDAARSHDSPVVREAAESAARALRDRLAPEESPREPRGAG